MEVGPVHRIDRGANGELRTKVAATVIQLELAHLTKGSDGVLLKRAGRCCATDVAEGQGGKWGRSMGWAFRHQEPGI